MYVTAVPETDGVLTTAPAVRAVRVAPTTEGTEDERVVTIADATPTVMAPTGAVDALEGHTRMLVEGTVEAIRRRVGCDVRTCTTVQPATQSHEYDSQCGDQKIARGRTHLS